MIINPIHATSSALAAFLASLVEFVEALTVILAVGSVRGWRSALAGTIGALAVLAVLIALFESALAHVPLVIVQLFIGGLLLLFGLRWLRKAVLRAAGVIHLHDEAAIFTKEATAMKQAKRDVAVWDKLALATTFQITMLEGIEVVFIVVAMGAGPGLLMPAIQGALAALFLVVLLGTVIKGPLTKVPENTLKFIVSVILTSFGIFWIGEGMGVVWPGGDLSILGLIITCAITALAITAICRPRRKHL